MDRGFNVLSVIGLSVTLREVSEQTDLAFTISIVALWLVRVALSVLALLFGYRFAWR